MDDRLTPDHFTDKELKWSYWFVTNQILLLRILFFFLLSVSVILGGIFIYKMVDMYVLKGPAYTQGLNNLVTTTANIGNLQLQGEAAITDIQIIDTQSLASIDNRVDLFALLGNANTKHFATFEYRFVGINDTTPWKEGFLLPNESRYIHELFYQPQGDMNIPTVEFRNIEWEKFLEYGSFADNRLRLEIIEPTFIGQTENEAGDVSGSKVTFTVKNNSSYSFRRVGFFVKLNIGQQVQAVNHIVLKNVNANSTLDVEVPFYDSVLNASSIEVLPEVNILDQTVYKPI